MVVIKANSVREEQVIFFTERENRGKQVKGLDLSGGNYFRLFTELKHSDFKKSDIAISFTRDDLYDTIVDRSKQQTLHKNLDNSGKKLNFGDIVVCYRVNLTAKDCIGVYVGPGEVWTTLGLRKPNVVFKVELADELLYILDELKTTWLKYSSQEESIPEEPEIGLVIQQTNLNSAYVYLGKAMCEGKEQVYYVYARFNMKRGFCTNTLKLTDREKIWENMTRIMRDSELGGSSLNKEPKLYTSILGKIDLGGMPKYFKLGKNYINIVD